MPHLLPMEASKLLPHRAPMCCIDKLLTASIDKATAEVLLSNDHILMENGTMNVLGYIELAAQTAGAMQGYATVKNGIPPQEGFLVAVQQVEFLAPAEVNTTLHIAVELVGEYQGVSVLSFLIQDPQEVKARGKLKVYVETDNA